MLDSATILCVDDEPLALQVRALVLSRAGYRVLTATSGKAAMEIFPLNHVDLVIVDQLLPDLDGTDLIGLIKFIRPEVPVVLLTGLVEQPITPAKPDLFITKGITPAEFLAEIRRLIPPRRGSSEKMG